MSAHRPSHPGSALAEAKRAADRYDWGASSVFFQKALDEIVWEADPASYATVVEMLARAQFKWAFQAETREEFKKRMGQSRSSYETASTVYEEKTRQSEPSKRAMARALFASFWMEEDMGRRRTIIERSIALAEEAAEVLERRHNDIQLADTHRDLLNYLWESKDLARDYAVLKGLFDRALQIGEKSIKEFQALGDNENLAECLFMTMDLNR